MAKSPDAFRTISEVALWLGTAAHVLRFWESKFTVLSPVQRKGGRRYYRQTDMALLSGIKFLLYEQGMTIKAVQKLLKDSGSAHVQNLSPKTDIIKSYSDLESNLPKKILSDSTRSINSLNNFFEDKVGQSKYIFESESLNHKDQQLLFPELELQRAAIETETTQIAVNPLNSTKVVKSESRLAFGTELASMDASLVEFVGQIGPITRLLGLSIMDKIQIINTSNHIIIQLQQLQQKLSA